MAPNFSQPEEAAAQDGLGAMKAESSYCRTIVQALRIKKRLKSVWILRGNWKQRLAVIRIS